MGQQRKVYWIPIRPFPPKKRSGYVCGNFSFEERRRLVRLVFPIVTFSRTAVYPQIKFLLRCLRMKNGQKEKTAAFAAGALVRQYLSPNSLSVVSIKLVI
jgi:hypothetical protein